MGRYRRTFVAAQDALQQLGCKIEACSRDDTEELRERWRKLFARPMHRSLGVWHQGGYDWHVFSGNHTHALVGEDARMAYRNETAERFFVLPNEKSGLACQVESKIPSPALDGEQDVYVVSPDFAWTMVYTHEDGWLGPYFCRAEWVDTPPTKETKSAPEKRTRRRNGSRR